MAHDHVCLLEIVEQTVGIGKGLGCGIVAVVCVIMCLFNARMRTVRIGQNMWKKMAALKMVLVVSVAVKWDFGRELVLTVIDAV